MNSALKLCGVLVLSSVVVAGCTSTGALDMPVYKNSNAVKLSEEEISKLIVGKKLTINEFKGVILYHADGKYEYLREGSTFIATYRIQGDEVCLGEKSERGLCANYFLLDNRYYWSNTKQREYTAVVDVFEDIEGEGGKSVASASAE